MRAYIENIDNDLISVGTYSDPNAFLPGSAMIHLKITGALMGAPHCQCLSQTAIPLSELPIELRDLWRQFQDNVEQWVTGRVGGYT
jgi:hypothetical protein